MLFYKYNLKKTLRYPPVGCCATLLLGGSLKLFFGSSFLRKQNMFIKIVKPISPTSLNINQNKKKAVLFIRSGKLSNLNSFVATGFGCAEASREGLTLYFKQKKKELYYKGTGLASFEAFGRRLDFVATGFGCAEASRERSLFLRQCKNMAIKKNLNTLRNSIKREKCFWNQTFDKGRLKNFVLWFLLKHGEHKTINLVEELKNIGFQYATKAGISLGIEDLRIPKKKYSLIMEAELLSVATIKQYKQGEITGVERFQRLIDTWHRTSERLKQEVIDNFEATDILNPVYMMAFSGARGNISQVRQLVGMRGLMSNPQGQIIDFPIRSNFREGLTLTEYIISSYGARKGIVDTALRTANAGYLTRRLVDVAQHVIISNFDCGTKRGIFLTDMKEGNKTIYSLQNRLIGRVLARDIYNKQKTQIASRNIEVSVDLANAIALISKKVFVRSALTCQTKKLVCQLCYGWSLAQGNLVPIGEAVGVVAAQSIGEPGTQLTMRTFHTGGVFSGDISDQIRAPFDGIVEYNNPIAGTLIRTPEGKIAFLTKNEGSFMVHCSYIPSNSLGKAVKAVAVTPLEGSQSSQEEHFALQNVNSLLTDSKTVGTGFDKLGMKSDALNNLERVQANVTLQEENMQLKAKETKRFKIPFYTLLFLRNGEKVAEKEVIAQISFINRQKNATDQAELTIKSELSGQFYSKILDLKENKVGPKLKNQSLSSSRQEGRQSSSVYPLNGGAGTALTGLASFKGGKNIRGNEMLAEQFNENAVDTIFEAWGWGYAWVLSGKIYQLSLPSSFFPIFGDYINQKTYMNKINWHVSSSFGSAFKLNRPLNKKFFNKKEIKSRRDKHIVPLQGGEKLDGASIVSNSKLSLNKKELPLLKNELISFQLSKIVYKKIGYFLKLAEPSSSFCFNKHNFIATGFGAAEASRYKKGSDAKEQLSILSAKDTIFLLSSIFTKKMLSSPNNKEEEAEFKNHSAIPKRGNPGSLVNSVHPSNWRPSFDIFLNWFPKRLSTKTGGLIFMEPIFFGQKILSPLKKTSPLFIKSNLNYSFKIATALKPAPIDNHYKELPLISFYAKHRSQSLTGKLSQKIPCKKQKNIYRRKPVQSRLSHDVNSSLEGDATGRVKINSIAIKEKKVPSYISGTASYQVNLLEPSKTYVSEKYFKKKKTKNLFYFEQSSFYSYSITQLPLKRELGNGVLLVRGLSNYNKEAKIIKAQLAVAKKDIKNVISKKITLYQRELFSRSKLKISNLIGRQPIAFFPTFIRRDRIATNVISKPVAGDNVGFNRSSPLNIMRGINNVSGRSPLAISSILIANAKSRLKNKSMEYNKSKNNLLDGDNLSKGLSSKSSFNKSYLNVKGSINNLTINTLNQRLAKSLLFEQYQQKQFGTVLHTELSINKNKTKTELLTFGLTWKNSFKLNSNTLAIPLNQSLITPTIPPLKIKKNTTGTGLASFESMLKTNTSKLSSDIRTFLSYNSVGRTEAPYASYERIFWVSQPFYNLSNSPWRRTFLFKSFYKETGKLFSFRKQNKNSFHSGNCMKPLLLQINRQGKVKSFYSAFLGDIQEGQIQTNENFSLPSKLAHSTRTLLNVSRPSRLKGLINTTILPPLRNIHYLCPFPYAQALQDSKWSIEISSATPVYPLYYNYKESNSYTDSKAESPVKTLCVQRNEKSFCYSERLFNSYKNIFKIKAESDGKRVIGKVFSKEGLYYFRSFNNNLLKNLRKRKNALTSFLPALALNQSYFFKDKIVLSTSPFTGDGGLSHTHMHTHQGTIKRLRSIAESSNEAFVKADKKKSSIGGHDIEIRSKKKSAVKKQQVGSVLKSELSFLSLKTFSKITSFPNFLNTKSTLFLKKFFFKKFGTKKNIAQKLFKGLQNITSGTTYMRSLKVTTDKEHIGEQRKGTKAAPFLKELGTGFINKKSHKNATHFSNLNILSPLKGAIKEAVNGSTPFISSLSIKAPKKSGNISKKKEKKNTTTSSSPLCEDSFSFKGSRGKQTESSVKSLAGSASYPLIKKGGAFIIKSIAKKSTLYNKAVQLQKGLASKKSLFNLYFYSLFNKNYKKNSMLFKNFLSLNNQVCRSCLSGLPEDKARKFLWLQNLIKLLKNKYLKPVFLKNKVNLLKLKHNKANNMYYKRFNYGFNNTNNLSLFTFNKINCTNKKIKVLTGLSAYPPLSQEEEDKLIVSLKALCNLIKRQKFKEICSPYLKDQLCYAQFYTGLNLKNKKSVVLCHSTQMRYKLNLLYNKGVYYSGLKSSTETRSQSGGLYQNNLSFVSNYSEFLSFERKIKFHYWFIKSKQFKKIYFKKIFKINKRLYDRSSAALLLGSKKNKATMSSTYKKNYRLKPFGKIKGKTRHNKKYLLSKKRKAPALKFAHIMVKPGWLYCATNLSHLFLHNQKLINPGKSIGYDLVFDRHSVYVEIISLDKIALRASKNDFWMQSNKMSASAFLKDSNISLKKLNKRGTPQFKNLYQRLYRDSVYSSCYTTEREGSQSSRENLEGAITTLNTSFNHQFFNGVTIKNNKCRFEPQSLKNLYLSNKDKSCHIKKLNSSKLFFVLIRKASEYKLFKDIEHKKEIYKIANQKNNGPALYNLNLVLAGISLWTKSYEIICKCYKNLPSKINSLAFKKCSLATLFISDVLISELVNDHCFVWTPVAKSIKSYKSYNLRLPNWINKAFNSIHLYSQYKTGLLNKQKITSQTISKFPSSDLKVISNILFYSSLSRLKQGTLFKTAYSNYKAAHPYPLVSSQEGEGITLNQLENKDKERYAGAARYKLQEKNIYYKINKASSWGLPCLPITSLKAINLSPLIISYKAPYSLDFPFKTPMRLFSEPYKQSLFFNSFYRSPKNYNKPTLTSEGLGLELSPAKQNFLRTDKSSTVSPYSLDCLEGSQSSQGLASVKEVITPKPNNKEAENVKASYNINYGKDLNQTTTKFNYKRFQYNDLKKVLYTYQKKINYYFQRFESSSARAAYECSSLQKNKKSEYYSKDFIGCSITKKTATGFGAARYKKISLIMTEREALRTGKVMSVLSSVFSCPIVEYSLGKDFEKSISYPNNVFGMQNTFSLDYKGGLRRPIWDLNQVDNKKFLYGSNGPVLGYLNGGFEYNKYSINKEASLYKTEFLSFINNGVCAQLPFIKTYTYCSFEGELIYRNSQILFSQKFIKSQAEMLHLNKLKTKNGNKLNIISPNLINSRILNQSKKIKNNTRSFRIKGESVNSITPHELISNRRGRSPLQKKDFMPLSEAHFAKQNENQLINSSKGGMTSGCSRSQSLQEKSLNDFFANKSGDNNCMILTKNDQISFYFPVDNYKENYFSLENLKKKNQYVINDIVINFLNILFVRQNNKDNIEQQNKVSSSSTESKITDVFLSRENNELNIKEVNLANNNEFIFKINKLPAGMSQQISKLLIGDFLVYGDQISSMVAISKPGQIIHINNSKITIRKGQPIFVSPKAILHKYDGDFIDEQSSVITLSYQQLKTGDIIQGIPKVEQFFEARTTKRGRLFRDSLSNLLKGLFKRYRSKLPFDQAVRQSFYKIQQIIVDGVQRVYRSQGVTIADKHLEVIVKQMTSKVRIIEGGQTGFFPGEIVDLDFVEQVNNLLMKKIIYEPLVLGITKASLEVDSFLSAASFQQTTRVLSKAAISRKKDFLKGLKENVILGNLIPAGTGYLVYLDQI